MQRRQRGFSLIELLIVVTIILIIAAVAIPNLIKTKATANEASAVTSLTTLNSTSIMYSMTYGGFPHALADLGPASGSTSPTSASADLIDSILASGNKSGYHIVYAAGATDTSGNVLGYSIAASPISPGTTGTKYFYTDQTGVIRASTAGPADKNSTPIG